MNKLIRKITLSGVTLGVAALSVTTSTFAWFTTNSEAKASSVSGTVSASGSNMLIKTYKDTSWTPFAKEVIFDAGSTQLVPVTYQTSDQAGFYKADNTTENSFSVSATDKTDYLHYQVIFGLSSLATASNMTNTVSLEVNDFKSETDKEQYLLVDAGDGAKAGDTIKVNLLDVLSMRVESKLITSSDTAYGITAGDIPTIDNGNFTATNSCYRYRAESTQVLTKTSRSGDFSLSNADALTYYNNVYNVSASRPSDDTPRGYNNSSYTDATNLVTKGESDETPNEIKLFTIKGSEKAYVMCDIYFYIDGWDYQCFNAVGGLKLDSGILNFSLTTAKSTN